MTPAAALALAFGALGASVVVGPRQPRAWLALTVTGAAAALAAATTVLAGGADWEWRSPLAVGGEALHLRLDGLSAWFLALLAVVGGAGAVYARGYASDPAHPDAAPRGRAWWSGLVLSMCAVLTSSNGLHFLIAWELFSVCAYALVTLDRTRRDVRAAGWLYLAVSHAAALLLFVFFATLAVRTGGWDLGPMREHADLAPLFWLALVGFGMKAGVFPLHVWLPSAHASAPSHVSALMSGVAIKLGVYGLLRFSGWLPVPAAAGWVVLGLGAASALAGIAFAFAQNDLKRLLAYCSVENVGIVFVGVGGALLARSSGDAAWGRLVLAGALLHVWNHGVFKALLFFGAGAVLHATGTRELSRLGGLWRAMPWTATCFGVGAAAVAALPPLNGFVGEWLVYLGLFDAAAGRDPATWATLPATLALAMSGALALATFVKAAGLAFLGAPRTAPAARAHECGPWMRAPMAGLAVLCVALGLAPVLVAPALARVVGGWNAAWVAPTLPAPLATLGAVHATVAALAVAAGVLLWRQAHARGWRRGPTWDCGYAAPTARMQFTGGSFASTGAGWFDGLLRPVRKVRRPHGLFPSSALRLERFPETVLERVLVPVGRLFVTVSTAVRRLQHGRSQAYILYLLVAVVAVGAVVLLGGRP